MNENALDAAVLQEAVNRGLLDADTVDALREELREIPDDRR